MSAQTPFALSAPSELAPWTPCMVTSVDGDVRRIVGDTILLACVGGVVPAARPDGTGASCPTHSAVTFVRTPATDLAVRRSDPGRTTLLLVGIATAFVGFAAYAASHIEMPLP